MNSGETRARREKNTNYQLEIIEAKRQNILAKYNIEPAKMNVKHHRL